MTFEEILKELAEKTTTLDDIKAFIEEVEIEVYGGYINSYKKKLQNGYTPKKEEDICFANCVLDKEKLLK